MTKTTFRALTVLLPAALLIGGCFRQPKTPATEAFDRLYQNSRQGEAIDIEMLAHLQDAFKHKPGLEEASDQALRRLETIRESTKKLRVEGDLAQLQKAQLDLFAAMRDLYKGIARKSGEEVTAGYRKGAPFAQDFIGKLQAYRLAKRPGKPEIVHSMEAYDRELFMVKGKEDAQAYTRMVLAIRDGKLPLARKILDALRAKYQGSDFGTCLDLRYSDLKMKTKPTDEAGALELLEGVLKGEGYSPDLAEAFWKWRNLAQILHHGTGNDAEIPNWEYNEVRWKLLMRIRQYQKLFPDEDWASEQAWALMDLPNLNRGGPQGNESLVNRMILYDKPGYFYESIR